MTPQYKSAGLSILRYVYETCELLGVQKGEIAELLTDLKDAVLIGQHDKEIPTDGPSVKRITGHHLSPHLVAEIERLARQGMSRNAVAKFLKIDWGTADRYMNRLAGTIPVAETPPAVLPQSNGATDRRADDQEPPKV